MRYNNDPMNEEVKDPAVDQAVAAPAEPLEPAPESVEPKPEQEAAPAEEDKPEGVKEETPESE
jgi:hypothetical protein